MRSRIALPIAALAAASAWCVGLALMRARFYGSGYPYLVWNLTLAWIPLALAVLLVAAYLHHRHLHELLAIGVAWLLFLPNAPYVLTDFVHLDHRHRLVDALVIGSFACTSLLLGFASLVLVQLVVMRAAGPAVGWAVVAGSLSAASVGIYLGRVHPLNSWDVLHRPELLWRLARVRLDAPLANHELIAFVVAFGGFLLVTYAALWGIGSALAGVLASNRTWPSR
jgi:uncharacterized membrane protein